MQITIDSNELSASDKELLRTLLFGADSPASAAVPAPTKSTTAVKTEAQPKAEPVAEVAPEVKPDPTPEPTPEPAEDLLGGGPTVDDAMKVAAPLVSAGKTAVVKAALEQVGAPKVGKLEGEQIAKFIAILEG